MRNNPKLNEPEEPFVIILCDSIKSDGVVSDIERKKFKIAREESDALFKNAINQKDYDKYMALLKEAFTNAPNVIYAISKRNNHKRWYRRK